VKQKILLKDTDVLYGKSSTGQTFTVSGPSMFTPKASDLVEAVFRNGVNVTENCIAANDEFVTLSEAKDEKQVIPWSYYGNNTNPQRNLPIGKPTPPQSSTSNTPQNKKKSLKIDTSFSPPPSPTRVRIRQKSPHRHRRVDTSEMSSLDFFSDPFAIQSPTNDSLIPRGRNQRSESRFTFFK